VTAPAVGHMASVPLSGWHIDATPHAEETLRRMARVCAKAVRNVEIVRYANEIIEAARPRDYRAQIALIRLFLETYFRFVDNPRGVQLVRDPLSMILDIERRGFTQGACDDAAVLVATFGMANGLSAQFRAVAFAHRQIAAGETPPPFSHVIADLWNGERWEDLDVTRPHEMTRPPVVVRTLTFPLD
jgi:hypothetical protein